MGYALASLEILWPMMIDETVTTQRQQPWAGRSATSPWKRRLRISVEANDDERVV